MYNNIKNIKI